MLRPAIQKNDCISPIHPVTALSRVTSTTTAITGKNSENKVPSTTSPSTTAGTVNSKSQSRVTSPALNKSIKSPTKSSSASRTRVFTATKRSVSLGQREQTGSHHHHNCGITGSFSLQGSSYTKNDLLRRSPTPNNSISSGRSTPTSIKSTGSSHYQQQSAGPRNRRRSAPSTDLPHSKHSPGPNTTVVTTSNSGIENSSQVASVCSRASSHHHACVPQATRRENINGVGILFSHSCSFPYGYENPGH
ncbi:unnamed protein product [Allacma fusca]|uniref:Uncharacterized protein n=1 Tax=Allacma fusca TaxID=39272 RepID=A0A8J2KPY0_9HEXA|nr:unnamed protein product [Allacma fusca]